MDAFRWELATGIRLAVTTTAAAVVVTGVLIVFSSVAHFAQRASNGMSAWASGLPQPVTGSQPGAA
jgi:hypothetical protein